MTGKPALTKALYQEVGIACRWASIRYSEGTALAMASPRVKERDRMDDSIFSEKARSLV